MSDPVMQPSIGRRVWYWPSAQDRHDENRGEVIPTRMLPSRIHQADPGQPCDAGIAYVHSDNLVNLTVADHAGQMHTRSSVRLVVAGDAAPIGAGYAQWMPYQVGQAIEAVGAATATDGSEIKVGDMVKLKSGGPMMVVDSQSQAVDMATTTLLCIWYDPERRINKANRFHKDALVKRPSAEAKTDSATVTTHNSIGPAFRELKAAIAADPGYAWGWHCNLAMPISDVIGVSKADANKAAARLMSHIFGIDTSANEHYPKTVVESSVEVDHSTDRDLAEPTDEMVNRFLQWPVPAHIHPDGTAGQPGRIGTNLLDAATAKAMLAHVLGG